MSPKLPAYDIHRSYDENYERAPAPTETQIPKTSGAWKLAGKPLATPFGIAAGPLLNGRWCEYYASLGFAWVTYKTVRSCYRESYPLPNLQPLSVDGALSENGHSVSSSHDMSGSWAVSFGMPSKPPEIWRRDVEETRQRLPATTQLSVSVVGTTTEQSTLDSLADDYAQCAYWAQESGADFVEANFSCPNVCTRDGQLYQQPDAAALVAERIHDRLNGTPLLIKIGFVPTPAEAQALALSLSGRCHALVTTNGLAAFVRSPDGSLMFDGQMRGVAGESIREAALAQVGMFRGLAQQHSLALDVVGVGGISNATHVREFLRVGASCVQLASAVMTHPECGLEMCESFATTSS